MRVARVGYFLCRNEDSSLIASLKFKQTFYTRNVPLCQPDLLLVNDVLLGPVDDPDDAEFHWDDAATENVYGICAGVHQVQLERFARSILNIQTKTDHLGDDGQGPPAVRVDLASELEGL